MFQQNNTSHFRRWVAILSGASLLIMAVSAFFAINLPTADAGLSSSDLSTQIRGNLFAWLIILITDLVVSWGLYVYFEETNRPLSLLTAWFRLLYTAILGMAIAELLRGFLPILTEFPSNLVAEPLELGTMIRIATDGFNEIWSFGLIVFGGHLLLLGWLVLQAHLPRLLGWLILLAGVGYLIVHTGHLVSADFAPHKAIIEMIFMLPMIAGEIGLAIWLLIKGGK